jgi:CRISPR type III-B/RAMP module RAMP protein Cmr1
MTELRLTLNSITPLLMNRLASDPRSDAKSVQLKNAPQIRAASFRGVFRYWLRAILGSTLPFDQIPQFEEGVFGSTQRGSTVKIIVESSLKPQNDIFVLPVKITNQNTGQKIDYPQYGYPVDSSFALSLHTHPLIPQFPLLMEETVNLAILLGGFGRRARRLGGNLMISRDNDQDQPMPETSSDVESSIKQAIQDALKTTQVLTKKAPVRLKQRPTFPCFADGYYSILLAEPYRDIESAYDKLWSASGKFHHAGGAYGKPSPRRASAVHMKLIVSQAGYHPVMTIFEWGVDRDWQTMAGFEAHVIQEGFSKIL